ncbi:MAG TPA: type II secretion system protein GspG [Phycisphaerales bacterium]|mgnify:FL=1|nr:type II secretion system protein GspG [Phycisphaerales bacterium]
MTPAGNTIPPHASPPGAPADSFLSGHRSPTPSPRRRIPLWILLVLLPLALVAILAIGYAGLAFLNIGFSNASARRASILATMKAIDSMLKTYHLDHGAYPPSLSALVPKYVQRIPSDPWTRPYGYALLPKGGPHPYMLYSTGPSGELGSADNIDYWTDVHTKSH